MKTTNNVEDTLKERGESYGEFTTQGMYTQRLKELFRDEEGSWEYMDDDMKEALDMIASKIARLINGNPSHIDSWHDIQGYARLVEARLIEDLEEAHEMGAAKAKAAGNPSSEFDFDSFNEGIAKLPQPKWEIDPAFHPTASVMGLAKDFPKYIDLTAEVAQGVEYDDEGGTTGWARKAEQEHPDAVLPGFAGKPVVPPKPEKEHYVPRVGDRVRVLVASSRALGEIGTVIESSTAPWIRMDNYTGLGYANVHDLEGWKNGHMLCVASYALEPLPSMEAAHGAMSSWDASGNEIWDLPPSSSKL